MKTVERRIRAVEERPLELNDESKRD
jgi:hypothetical protein